jgi:hypothetical protein
MPDDRSERSADTDPAPGRGPADEPAAKAGMRCTACGLVWYSEVAELVVRWSASVCCRAPMELVPGGADPEAGA